MFLFLLVSWISAGVIADIYIAIVVKKRNLIKTFPKGKVLSKSINLYFGIILFGYFSLILVAVLLFTKEKE